MNPDTRSLKERMERVLQGKASKEEAEAFLQLPVEELDAYLNEKEWEAFQPGLIPEEWSSEWYKNIKGRIKPPVRHLHWKRWLSVAALLVLMMGAVFYYNKDRRPLAAPMPAVAGQSQPAFKERLLINKGNHLKTYVLPDSSLADLAPASTLRYLDPMETGKRSLWLEGEAVFHVKKDPSRPFTVYVTGFATTALGTVFKVSSFKGKVASVLLISGKIKVTNQHNKQVFYLTAGEQCSFDKASLKLKMNLQQKVGGMSNKGSRGRALINETTDNDISFNQTPLPDVFSKIEAVYNIHIVYSPEEAGSRTFTGSFKKVASPEEVLETIVLLNDLKMKRVADTIYLRKK